MVKQLETAIDPQLLFLGRTSVTGQTRRSADGNCQHSTNPTASNSTKPHCRRTWQSRGPTPLHSSFGYLVSETRVQWGRAADRSYPGRTLHDGAEWRLFYVVSGIAAVGTLRKHLWRRATQVTQQLVLCRSSIVQLQSCIHNLH